MSHHQNMVHDAKYAMDDLDIVFFGDDMIEEFSGTKILGSEITEGMEAYFEKTFTKKGGGKLNGLALGSYGDTVRVMLGKPVNSIRRLIDTGRRRIVIASHCVHCTIFYFESGSELAVALGKWDFGGITQP
jgi:hypothetical protein